MSVNNKYTIYDKLIREIGNKLIYDFADTNNVKTGTNGPYNDKETSVRNLSHLIVITSIEILVFDKAHYKSNLLGMAEKLKNLEIDGLYKLRDKEGKDKANGVIGHAWVMEAYIYLYKVFKNDKYLNTAKSIYNQHEFNKSLKLWQTPRSPFGNGKIDYTYNHQLWFAAISSELYAESHSNKIKSNVNEFLDNLNSLTNIDFNGLIHHFIIKNSNKKRFLKSSLKRYIDLANRLLNKPSYEYKENGYHIFNLAAYARIYMVFKNHSFWFKKKFKKALNYANSDDLLRGILSENYHLDKNNKGATSLDNYTKINIYGIPYNVPGFELRYLNLIFKEQLNEGLDYNYIQKQMEFTYSVEGRQFGVNCYDNVTINYRIYEYYKAFELE